jgi:serine/threonine-protein kinase
VTATAPARTVPPASAGSLAGLVGLGALASLWSLVLWAELWVSRRGGAAVCALGEAADCAALWDGAFATAVHRASGLPLAGWGLAWGLAALALPLVALTRLAEGRPVPALVSACRLVAVAGVAAVVGLLGVSLAAGAVCAGCFVVYVLVAGYAGIALYGWRTGWPDLPRGAALAALAAGLAALLLLYPGTLTPPRPGEAGRAAVAGAAVPAADPGPGTGDPQRDALLAEFVESLSAPLRQSLADSLNITASSAVVSMPQPRHLLGPADAPIRITEWSDVLCGHCAALHDTLGELRRRLPAGAFSVEARQFPLDGECNPLVGRREPGSVRCLAAKATLCIPGEKGWTFSGELFASQEGLTAEKVYALAGPYLSRRELDACMASEATRRALAEDIKLARSFHPDGTPIVAVNGRQGTSFGPYLYAIILAAGEVRHPAFAALPPANPNAHIH